MTILELAVGIALGLALHNLITTIAELPFAYAKYRAHKKKHREMLEFMREATDGLVKHLETHNHGKGAKNARNNSQKAKTTGKRSNATAGVKAKKVSTVKKGVQNGRQRKQA